MIFLTISRIHDLQVSKMIEPEGITYQIISSLLIANIRRQFSNVFPPWDIYLVETVIVGRQRDEVEIATG